jgi:hypothetical protein
MGEGHRPYEHRKARCEMSLLAICCLTVGAIGVLKLGWAALKPLPDEMGRRQQDRMEYLLALHAPHFPQLWQALATLNDDSLRRKASGEIERHLHEERRHVVESFLMGLADDFGQLERLLSVVQLMSPAQPWMYHFRRADSRCRFRVNDRLARLQIHSERPQSRNRLARLVLPACDQSPQMRSRSPADPD